MPPESAKNSPQSAANLDSPCFLGVDVGGTNIKIGLVDDHGRTLEFDSITSVDENGAQGAISRAAQTCRQLAKQAGVDWDQIPRAGLGTPGPQSLPEGKLLNPSNLPGWHNFKIQAALERELGMPVSYINDANAAAYGEFWVGTGAAQGSLALLTLGTGVGGGLIVDGKLINGVNSFGSEVGHVIVDGRQDARLCVWGGGQGQLEAYASASAVAAQAEAGLRRGRKSSLSDVASAGGSLTAKHVYKAALIGDEFALEIIDEAAYYLGIGVTNTVHMIDPGLVVLGGAMNFGGSQCQIGRRFLEGVRKEFKRRTFPNVYEGTKIDFATLGGDAGYIGAAGIARKDFRG